ncbi:hypothetical protein [[Mycobacterium] burgundiense]|uniref:ER-bound oxygenase mpaB/mpaB'/Rubber oxygenase catalytic domain-containing protein n=1 Tax=[Mycobacterium] burgundiense TaxID=3064286 RepID=A0ABN9NW40_9MYCO|nr:hypothetical protein [Mycolicibacterium sp. MU0053]CAJ1511151.1 hypothetical protein MU0053_005068 [Mycolicibacterium sp. MU0053]
MSAEPAELDIAEGALAHGLPYLALGSGRPLVFLRWFTADHKNPSGPLRTSEIKTLAPLAHHFRVYAVNRAPGMSERTTMADIATQHAEALRAEFGGPVRRSLHLMAPLMVRNPLSAKASGVAMWLLTRCSTPQTTTTRLLSSVPRIPSTSVAASVISSHRPW